MSTKRDVISEGLDSSPGLYIPPPPHITIHAEEYPSLVDLLVGDTVDLEITARVTRIEESGEYGLELMMIKVADKNDLRAKAESEIINIGTLDHDTLDNLFSGRTQ